MQEIEKHFLYPSAIFVNTKPYQVNTILGSCVAVCIFDPILKIGGINHYMLSLWNGQGLATPKYGNIAIERLVERLIGLGAKPGYCKAKIFGGSEIIISRTNQFHVGKRNIIIAHQMLNSYEIPIVSSSTGGKLGRKISFFTHTGEVKQKYINNQNNKTCIIQ